MPKSVEFKITEKRLREIVIDELKKKHGINEAVDADAVKSVVNAASKLLKAATAFKADANVALQNALSVEVAKIISTLEQVMQNPASYTDKVKVEPKRIKLRRVDENKPKNIG